MSGGAWSTERASAQRAPILSLTTTEDGKAPDEIRLPLPPALTGQREEDVEREARHRLSAEYGSYAAGFTPGGSRQRCVLIRRVPPLPTILRYDGRRAERGSRVFIGRGLAGRSHTTAPGSAGVMNGDTFDFTWDLRAEPHGIAVGTTGTGKSQTVQLAMMQLALAGWRLILIDPKQVEFSRWVGRPGVIKVTTDLDEHVEALEQAQEEMLRRNAQMAAAGKHFIDLLPQEDRLPRVLVVVDEAVELLATSKARDAATKDDNDLKARAARAIESILALGRAAGVHLLLCAQRADREVITGAAQNNAPFRILHGEAGQIERGMIRLDAVKATPGVSGRAVACTNRLPQTEVQVAYVDLQQDLDLYLPVGGSVTPEVVEITEEDLRVPEPTHPATPFEPLPDGFDYEVSAPGSDRVDGSDGEVPEATRDAAGGDRAIRHGGSRVEPLRPGQALSALDALHGLPSAKARIHDLEARLRVAERRRTHGRGSAAPVVCDHLVFTGPPGTGKTTVARIVGSLLRDLGVLDSGHVIECASRAALVAGYVGQTSQKVEDAVKDAMGGVLFIDEFYTYTGEFGEEAIQSLMTAAENHRGSLVIIIAGYEAEMTRMLTETNVGLDSRFPTRVPFEAYTAEDLTAISLAMVEGKDLVPGEEVAYALSEVLGVQDLEAPTWGNARSARTLVDAAATAADRRLADDSGALGEALHTVIVEDVVAGAHDLGWVLPSVDATEAGR